MDDRLLAHLKVVIVAKLRRGEPFLLSWTLGAAEGSGRKSLWMHPSIPLQFEFDGSRRPTLNRAWLDELMASSMTNQGMLITDEPPEQPESDIPELSATAV
jgi:hypothetical protein